MDYHKWLYRSRRLVAEVEAAMGNLSEHIALDDALPNLFYNGETDARTVKRKLKEARMVFRESWWAISDRWTTIRGNEALELELFKHRLHGSDAANDTLPNRHQQSLAQCQHLLS